MVIQGALNKFRKRLLGNDEDKQGSYNARIIAVAAQKGGVGKTTTTVHLAAAWAQQLGLKVLLLDMDGQGHVEKSLEKLIEAERPELSLGQLLLDKKQDVYDLVVPTSLENLYVVPSDRELHEKASIMASRIGRELLLRQALRLARTHFDVILIDCPPNLGTLTLNALVASDFVLVPCDMSILSLDGVETLIEAIETVQEALNPSLRLLGLVRTRVDRRHKKMNQAIEDTLLQNYRPWLLESVVGSSTSIAKSQLAGKPVFQHEPRSPGAMSYKALAVELARKLFPNRTQDL
jgi:chromosome partitioning protein